jgi:pimeloyl-ACP methyl ester carboxylesterase
MIILRNYCGLLLGVGLVWLTGLIGCAPPQVIRRPDLDLSPWVEKAVTSAQTGASYEYLHIESASPSATPVLLLHGGIFDNRIWYYFYELSAHHDLYALQWPDTSPLYTRSMSDHGAIAADFAGALGLEKVSVVGVSFGTYGAIDLATRQHGPRVESLVLISTVMMAVSEEEVKERTKMARSALFLGKRTLAHIVDSRVREKKYDTPPGRLGQEDIFWVRPPTFMNQVFGSAKAQRDTPQDTGAVTCPVLVLHGTGDNTMPVDVARETPALFPNARMRVFEGYSHTMVFDHGLELARVVQEFFASTLTPPARPTSRDSQ